MKKKLVIQTHHITYKPERTVNIFKGEHLLATRLSWRKNVSKGFIEVLKQYIKDNESKAVELVKEIKK